METNNRGKLARRDFLRVLAVGSGTAAGLAALPQGAAGAEADQEKRKARYQETDHVKTFYRVNRYPQSRS